MLRKLVGVWLGRVWKTEQLRGACYINPAYVYNLNIIRVRQHVQYSVIPTSPSDIMLSMLDFKELHLIHLMRSWSAQPITVNLDQRTLSALPQGPEVGHVQPRYVTLIRSLQYT